MAMSILYCSLNRIPWKYVFSEFYNSKQRRIAISNKYVYGCSFSRQHVSWRLPLVQVLRKDGYKYSISKTTMYTLMVCNWEIRNRRLREYPKAPSTTSAIWTEDRKGITPIQSTGPPRQSMGPPQTGAGVGIGLFNRKIIVNQKNNN